MIDPRARILLFFLGLAVLVLAVNLVRKRQLQERYALLWLLAGLVLVLAPLFVNVIDRLAARLVRRVRVCLLYTSPSPRDGLLSRMPSSA